MDSPIGGRNRPLYGFPNCFQPWNRMQGPDHRDNHSAWQVEENHLGDRTKEPRLSKPPPCFDLKSKVQPSGRYSENGPEDNGDHWPDF